MDWREAYKDKIMSPEAAFARIHSGDIVMSNFGGSIPYALLDALADYSLGHLENVTLWLAGFYKETKIGNKIYNDHVTVKSSFFGPLERRAKAEGSDLSYQAMHLSNASFDRLGKRRPDVIVTAGTEPDEQGRISLGVNPFDPALLDICDTLIVQVNRNMPFVCGEGCLIPAARGPASFPSTRICPSSSCRLPTKTSAKSRAISRSLSRTGPVCSSASAASPRPSARR